MKNVEYAVAYTEVLEILKYIPKIDYDKIPSEKIELYKTMQDKKYRFKYNPSKTLDEQNVSKRARAIIGLLFKDYWATETQKKKIIEKQNYERKKIEEQKRKIYNPDNIFKNNSKRNEKIENQEKENHNLPIEIKKQNIFQKLFSFIKRVLHY